MKPLVWEDLCVLKHASEEALLIAIEIIKRYVSDNVSEKDIRSRATTLRARFRRKLGKYRHWLRFLENEKDWLRSEVPIPANFLKTYQLPARPGVKFRGASNYCFMCSDMIGQWALPITWRLSKSLCTALKLEITAENLDFETNMVDCLLCSLCYEKTVEVNDIVEELEKTQVRMEKVGVEIDAIFARGMENVSPLKPIHGVDSRKFLSPADLRAHIVARRRRPSCHKNQDPVTKNGKNNIPVPFTITTRKSKALPEKTDSNEMSSGFRLSPECSDIRIDDTFTLASMNGKRKYIITQNISQRKETEGLPSVKRTMEQPLPLRGIKAAQFFQQQEEPLSEHSATLGAAAGMGHFDDDDFVGGIRGSNRSFKTDSGGSGLEEPETPNSMMSESILRVTELIPTNLVSPTPNMLKSRASITNVISVQKPTKAPAQHEISNLPHSSASCTSSYTKIMGVNSGVAHRPKIFRKIQLPSNTKRSFHPRDLLVRLLKANAKRARQIKVKKKMKARKAAHPLHEFSCPTEGCKFRFQNPTQLNSHILQNHSPDPRPFKCTYPECKKAYTSQRGLIKHSQLHLDNVHVSRHGETVCAECGKLLKSRQSLKAHMEKHEGIVKMKKRYGRRCPFPGCSFKSSNSGEFKIHSATHDESEKTVRCTQPGCTVMFPSEKEMERHKKSRHGDKVSCETCGRAFATRASLDRHIKLTHVAPGEKQWVCERCGDSFAVKHYLKRHHRAYPNCEPKAPKPGSVYCEICNQLCSSKNSLNRHLQVIHNREEKPWACNFCSRNFSIKMYLNRHLKESKYCPGSLSYREISNSTLIAENAGSTSNPE